MSTLANSKIPPPTPLNNPLPPPERVTRDIILSQGDGEREVVKKPEGKRDKPVATGPLSLWLRCPKCLAGKVVHVRKLGDKPYLVCDVCGEMNATEAWRVIFYGRHNNAFTEAEIIERRRRVKDAAR